MQVAGKDNFEFLELSKSADIMTPAKEGYTPLRQYEENIMTWLSNGTSN